MSTSNGMWICILHYDKRLNPTNIPHALLDYKIWHMLWEEEEDITHHQSMIPLH
jgi:hypothetical protein